MKSNNGKIGIAVALILVVLIGCAVASSLISYSHSMNYITSYEPSFKGVIEEITDEYVIINVSSDDALYSSYPVIYASADYEIDNIRIDEMYVGMEIQVFYDGTITGNNPAYVNHVYAFTD